MTRNPFALLLLAGAAAVLLVACAATYSNMSSTSDPKGLLGGTCIAFACGLVAIGSDLQGNVNSRLGSLANTSILQSWQGWACLLGWSAFNVTMFQIAQLYPTWASQTLHFDVDKNLLSTGLLVGVSATIIIRSKLTKVNDVEWGAEWVYLWSGAQVLDAVNRRRVTIKKNWEARALPFVRDLVGQPTLFTDLESHVTSLLPGSTIKMQESVTKELQRLRDNFARVGDPDPNVTVNASSSARRLLVSIVLDYFGDSELQNWATLQGLKL